VHKPQCTLKQGSATKPNTEAPTSTNLPPISHEESAVTKKQRPSKRARERLRKKLESLQLGGERTAGDQPHLL